MGANPCYKWHMLNNFADILHILISWILYSPPVIVTSLNLLQFYIFITQLYHCNRKITHLQFLLSLLFLWLSSSWEVCPHKYCQGLGLLALSEKVTPSVRLLALVMFFCDWISVPGFSDTSTIKCTVGVCIGECVWRRKNF